MITIVGAGALGSHTALLLRNLKQPLKIVDFDKVDNHNLQAQFHTKMGLRKNKAQALAQSLQGLWNLKIDVVPHKLTVSNVSTIFIDADLIIDCTDNIAARKLIQEYFDEYNVPCLHGALSADGTFARIVWGEDFKPDAENEEGEATCEDGEALPFFAFVSSCIAMEVQKFLSTGKKSSFQLTPANIIQLT